jgi:DNA repair exonuclease SbcCD ATPase subunit
MNLFRSLLSIVALGLTAVSAVGQTTVAPGSYRFSSGVHPTFSFVFEGTDAKYVESYWRDELKKISKEVSNKKEVIGAGAVIPQISPDTVRVLVKAEQHKGGPLLTAHVAFLTTAGFVGPSSDDKVFSGAQAFVQTRSTALRRQLAQQELTEAEKGLARLRTDLSNLQREKERAETSIEKSTQKAAEAVTEQEDTRKALDELSPRIDAKRNEVASTPSDEGTKGLNDLLKEQTRTLERNRKALETERSMKKKAEDLGLAIQKNLEEQARKQEAIDRQDALVNTLREKLAAIQ